MTKILWCAAKDSFYFQQKSPQSAQLLTDNSPLRFRLSSSPLVSICRVLGRSFPKRAFFNILTTQSLQNNCLALCCPSRASLVSQNRFKISGGGMRKAQWNRRLSKQFPTTMEDARKSIHSLLSLSVQQLHRFLIGRWHSNTGIFEWQKEVTCFWFRWKESWRMNSQPISRILHSTTSSYICHLPACSHVLLCIQILQSFCQKNSDSLLSSATVAISFSSPTVESVKILQKKFTAHVQAFTKNIWSSLYWPRNRVT